MVSKMDQDILRELGKQYMEAAHHERNGQNIKLWRALNRGKMERPMVVMDQFPYNELNEDGILDCHVSDPFWRQLESHMRKELYKWNNFPVDMVLDPFFKIPAAITNSGHGIERKAELLSLDHSSDVYSQKFESLLNREEDLDKIVGMKITHDVDETKRRLETAEGIFRGIGPVRRGGFQVRLCIWDEITQLMGVENAYIALMDEPDFIHKMLEKYTDSVIDGIRQVNELQISDDIANTCHCSFVYDDEYLPEPGKGKGPLTSNSWAFGMAQLFTSVSPSVTEEFEIPYITRMAQHYGMIYYGCCDMLHDRLELVDKIPNVRKISCSPWSNKQIFSERINPKYVISNKPNPAYVGADSFDESVIRKDLEETCGYAKQYGKNLEIILKDISTIQYQPQRLRRWYEIAMEAVNNW